MGTTDGIFIVRQMQEKFRAKRKKLYFGFRDLEKAFDGVAREVIRWAISKLGVEEWIVPAVMSVHRCKKVVRTVYGNGNSFGQRLVCNKVTTESIATFDCHGRFVLRIQLPYYAICCMLMTLWW